MTRVINVSSLTPSDELCPVRLATYPELNVPREQLSPEDLVDAIHQWAMPCRPHVTERCFEEGCDAIRATPFENHDERDQLFMIRVFARQVLRGEVTA